MVTRKNDLSQIWFLTSVYIESIMRHPTNGEIKAKHSTRTFGYYRGWAKAIKAVQENRCNMHECLYQYLIMERIGEGVHSLCKDEQWFRWTGRKWTSLKQKPEWARGTINWAIG